MPPIKEEDEDWQRKFRFHDFLKIKYGADDNDDEDEDDQLRVFRNPAFRLEVARDEKRCDCACCGADLAGDGAAERARHCSAERPLESDEEILNVKKTQTHYKLRRSKIELPRFPEINLNASHDGAVLADDAASNSRRSTQTRSSHDAGSSSSPTASLRAAFDSERHLPTPTWGRNCDDASCGSCGEIGPDCRCIKPHPKMRLIATRAEERLVKKQPLIRYKRITSSSICQRTAATCHGPCTGSSAPPRCPGPCGFAPPRCPGPCGSAPLRCPGPCGSAPPRCVSPCFFGHSGRSDAPMASYPRERVPIEIFERYAHFSWREQEASLPT